MRLIYAFSALAIAACSHQQGSDFTPSNAEQIRVGVSTKATVERLLGPPFNRYVKGGEETWTYSHMNMDATKSVGAGMLGVPVVGSIIYLATGAYNPTSNTDFKEATIVFRKDVVASCVVKQTHLAESGATTVQEVTCGQPAR